jgi:hypothetical protein
MSEWQPIETAPKDGTVIDLWAGQRRPGCFYERIDDPLTGEVYGEGWSQQYVENTSNSFRVFEDPTHWMPLPEPPQ